MALCQFVAKSTSGYILINRIRPQLHGKYIYLVFSLISQFLNESFSRGQLLTRVYDFRSVVCYVHKTHLGIIV